MYQYLNIYFMLLKFVENDKTIFYIPRGIYEHLCTWKELEIVE